MLDPCHACTPLSVQLLAIGLFFASVFLGLYMASRGED